MSSAVEKLRASRKNPSVLKLKVLKIRGEDPEVLIFVYEGPDDVPVYEEWMRRIANCPRFEPLPGAGKQQLLAYHKILLENADPLLDKIFFFVDRDFDLAIQAHRNLFELEAYSVENLICTEEVLDSILRDEFRRAGKIGERARVKAKFAELKEAFLECCRPVNLALFVAQRCSLRVEKKPEKISEIVVIDVNSISNAYVEVTDIISVENQPAGEPFHALEKEFSGLPDSMQQRGKYLLEMFRRWLRALTEDLKSPAPILFDDQDDRLPGDPSALPMRRLASSTPIPPNLSDFIMRSVIQVNKCA